MTTATATRFLFAAIVLAELGCASVRPKEVRYRPEFRYDLVEVQRPIAASEQYGVPLIEDIIDASGLRPHFEDRLVSVLLNPVHSRIGLRVWNKTDGTMRIPWGHARYVDIAGDSQPVMHRGQKYTDCPSPTASTVVPPRGRVTEDVMPCGAVRATYSTWFAEPLLPEMRIASGDTARMRAELQSSVVGKRFHLRLPLEVESVVNDYTFTFAITGFDFRAIDF